MPYEPADLARTVDSLRSALAHLDHATVDQCTVTLESQMAALRRGELRLAPEETTRLFQELKRVRMLVDNANRLYAGWARSAALDGGTYGASGAEVEAPAARVLIGQG
ncbi:MAG: hypothetical protein JSU00_02675 [Acidobacteria bacterium]|nr:hypothetical protein [Acidobacteriota bacterium]